MSVFKIAMVRGICDRLTDLDIVRFPDEKVAHDLCVKLAREQLNGPDLLPAGGLAPESAYKIAQWLKSASDQFEANGYGPSAMTVLRNKQASAMDWQSRAGEVAAFCMTKVADEASLTSVGKNTPESAAGTDQHAKLDLQNRPVGEYLVGVGNSDMPEGGVVGKEMEHPKAPTDGGVVSNSVVEQSKTAGRLMTALKSHGSLAKDKAVDFAKGVGDKVKKMPVDEYAMKGLGHAKKVAPYAAGAAALGGAAYGGKKLYDHLKGEKKEANEDVPAAALAGGQGGAPGGQGGADMGADPGALQRAMLFLQAMKNKVPGFQPGADAQVAAGGLAQSPEGLDVMNHVVDTAKTASDADALIAQILQHQGQVGELASPELIQALQAAMAQHSEPDGDEMPAQGGAPMAPESPAQKEARLLNNLKIAANASLTDVGKNTPQSAAQTDSFAKLDEMNRSAGAYQVAQGKSKMPNKGQQYSVQSVEKGPEKENPDTTPARETKSASLSEEDRAYLAALQKTASIYGAMLPANLTEGEKIAHLQVINGMVPSERSAYVANLRS